jgi:hypothetical protein
MKNTVYRLKRYIILITGFCLFCLFLHILSRAEECLFAIQLKDPVVRGEYEAAIAAGMTNDLHKNGALDPLAIQCLACHDGTIAKTANYRISDGTLYKNKSLETIVEAHPVGMNYRTSSMNREYVPEENFRLVWYSCMAELVV